MSGGNGLRLGIGWFGVALAVAGAAAWLLDGGVWSLVALGAGVLLAQALMLDTTPVKIPVFMFHSVADDRPDRPPAFRLYSPVAVFEAQLGYLRRRGYNTITLNQLDDHLRHGHPLPDRPVVLTFDDGYLDNWVHVAPLLARHGFTGTVFVPTDFIRPGDTCRPTMDDVWAGRAREDELETFGYLNEAEIRALAASGVLDVQSHGKSHTWLPVSERVIDFHHPGLALTPHLRWMWWNRFRDRKPFWFNEIAHEDLPWGAPVYENDLALARPAVRPDPGLEERLSTYVAGQGGKVFFERARWREELLSETERYRRDHPPSARPEDAAAFRARLADELRGSREVLERLTGREVRFMCWPNGGTCHEAFGLLEECGYLAATLPSRLGRRPNTRGQAPERISRIGSTSIFRPGRRLLPSVLSFAMKVERGRGLRYADLPIKAVWLWRRLAAALPASRQRG